MKAFEARKASVKPQFEQAMREIEQAVKFGRKKTVLLSSTTLYPEVAEMIAKEGYDVEIILNDKDLLSLNRISWEHAEEGKEGTVTYVDERDKTEEATHVNPSVSLKTRVMMLNLRAVQKEL